MATRIPINQLNALPIVTADSQTEPGDITVVGGTISRFWSGAQLGFPAVFVNDGSGASWLVSNALDVRGCSRFLLVVTRSYVAGGDVNQTVEPYRLVETVAGAQQDRTKINTLTRMNGNTTYNLGDPSGLVAGMGFDNTQQVAAGPGQSPGIIGERVRFGLRWGAVTNPNQSWAFELWGQT